MGTKEERSTDPLIDEVRQRRRDLLASHDNDLEKLLEAIQRLQAKHPEKVVNRKKLKDTPSR